MLDQKFNLQDLLDMGAVQAYRNSTIKDDNNKVIHKGDTLYYTAPKGEGKRVDTDELKLNHGAPKSCGGGVYVLRTVKSEADSKERKTWTLQGKIADQLASTNSLSHNRIGGKQGLIEKGRGVINALNNSNLTEAQYLNVIAIAEKIATDIRAKCESEMRKGEDREDNEIVADYAVEI